MIRQFQAPLESEEGALERAVQAFEVGASKPNETNRQDGSAHPQLDKKVSMLNQALLIGEWVQNFDAAGISDGHEDALGNSPNRIPP